ncbi:amidohydrolase family protein [Candidatus Woesearchaeota archaeon]|nr:amidohydrolase family protein [Candidatus Woesearchaeota archaeon]
MKKKIGAISLFILLFAIFIFVGCSKIDDSAVSDAYKAPDTDVSPELSSPEVSSPQILSSPQDSSSSKPTSSKYTKELSIEEKHWNRVFAKAFEEVDCPKAPERNFPDGYYKSKMIDTHIHIGSLPDGAPGFDDEFYTGDNIGIKRSISEWVCMMDYENTSKVFAFFPAWKPIIKQSIDLVKLTMEKYPGRFIPFIMSPDNDGNPDGFSTVDSKKLKEMLDAYPDLFKGYGEIGLYGHPGGAPPLPPNSLRLTEIYPLVKEKKLLVYFHLGEGQKQAFEETLSANPDINFIFHGDQLIDCSTCHNSLADVADLLEKHPNLYYGVDELYGDVLLINEKVTKQEFIAHFNDYEPLLEEDLKTWKKFIEDHSGQVLWGTDRGVGSSWSLDPEVALVLNNYSRAFISKLDPLVQEKFAYKNAEKLIGNINDTS